MGMWLSDKGKQLKLKPVKDDQIAELPSYHGAREGNKVWSVHHGDKHVGYVSQEDNNERVMSGRILVGTRTGQRYAAYDVKGKNVRFGGHQHTHKDDAVNSIANHYFKEEVNEENGVHRLNEDDDGYRVKKNKEKENHWDVYYHDTHIGTMHQGTTHPPKKNSIRVDPNRTVKAWEVHLNKGMQQEGNWVSRFRSYGHTSKVGALQHMKSWHKKPESTNEEIKRWKHAGRDLSKWRAEKGNTVKLVALKKDGNESKMHDATTSYTSLDYARRHHDNKVKLNPGRSIRHNVYVDGKLHDTWG